MHILVTIVLTYVFRQAKKKKKEMKLSLNTREGKRERSSYEVI